ncbi:MAG: ATP-binding cassette domain-containing protein [Calditrichia bacterium]
MHAVETHELTKFYSRGHIKALEDFSISVEEGQIFSLLGPNGAGKSTFIKILLGIVFPTRGRATILGQDISDYRIHSHIGYLAENHRFPEFLAAGQVLRYYGKISGIPESELKKRIPRLLQTVKLEEWADEKTKKFSKGMLQRLGVAQALINDPEILFLDEPTDGIDPVGRKEVRDLLKLLQEQGKTIFLNSHLLSEVERISDEVAILKDGRLLKKGTVADFISVEQQFQLQLEDGKELLNNICKHLGIPLVNQNGYYVVSVNDDAQLNHLIDQLRESKATIQAIIPRKISLEDFFIEVIETGEGENR